MIKSVDELNLCDDVLFHEVMKDEKLAVMLLEEVLDMKGQIAKVTYIESEKTIKNGISSKGVRFDVYLKDDKNIFEIEMQVTNRAIAKRSRKYQSAIDYEWLKKGENYGNLKPQYIIFICTFDLFKLGLHRYTFKNFCVQEKTIELGDETTKVFLNTRGTADDVNKNIKDFLHFVEHSTEKVADESDSELVKRAMQRIKEVRTNEIWGGTVMTLEEKIEERIEDALAAEAINNAKKWKEFGLPVEQISEITGLSVDEINALE